MKTVFKMLCGQLVTSVGIAMVIASGFGAFPCTTCNMAFVNWSGLSYGIINMFNEEDVRYMMTEKYANDYAEAVIEAIVKQYNLIYK